MNRIRLTLLLSVIVTCYFFMCLDGIDAHAGEYVTRSGKSLFIEESHPFGQSLSYIQLRSSGFEHDLSENLENSDPIQGVHVADLDGNGYDEFYIVTTSSGSGSYGNIVAFASNKDKSLSMIYFPKIQEGDEHFDGYMGHDSFHCSDSKLVRSFPVYLSIDKNVIPSGGTRRVTYGLFKGEASWQLRIIDSKNTN